MVFYASDGKSGVHMYHKKRVKCVSILAILVMNARAIKMKISI